MRTPLVVYALPYRLLHAVEDDEGADRDHRGGDAGDNEGLHGAFPWFLSAAIICREAPAARA